ncbi:viperin family antiviral radical SAM protein [uncultured Azohydromonas sp.]|uniref:viperin family antiviral radical SAM protein n=1 Tax=uncultured Azohydromonas sp. TaxID=487342 RepID=UPI00262719F0|nr:viperin family antiviral radical SAM protein [uncultured Azohydromonas sp.]
MDIPTLRDQRTAVAAPITVDELVVNWHVTEACNYRCGYCYAAWQREDGRRDVVRDEQATRELVSALWAGFHPGNTANALSRTLRWSHVRLSIAGGEPMLYPQQVLDIARQARELGMRVSLITNGSRLPEGEALEALARQLDVLGLSLDSFSTAHNLRIGRADSRDRTLSLADMATRLRRARAANPRLQVKINTVVSAVNAGEDLVRALDLLRPDRWKVLRMLPVVNSNLAVDDEAFASFVARHAGRVAGMSVEDNTDMLGSYVMVDPQGRFFQNGTGTQGSYFYSQPITRDTVHRAFASVPFLAERFAARYRPMATAHGNVAGTA